jgi:hypothetical protein
MGSQSGAQIGPEFVCWDRGSSRGFTTLAGAEFGGRAGMPMVRGIGIRTGGPGEPSEPGERATTVNGVRTFRCSPGPGGTRRAKTRLKTRSQGRRPALDHRRDTRDTPRQMRDPRHCVSWPPAPPTAAARRHGACRRPGSPKPLVGSPIQVNVRPVRPWIRRHVQPLSGTPSGPPARSTRQIHLDIYRLNQGVGLDFVRKREYGRLRWPKYPAETKRSIAIEG